MSDNKDDVQTEGSGSGDKIRVKFLFANRDGVTVEVECSLSDTVSMMKAALIERWPQDLSATAPTADRIRLICMGKGILSPDNASIDQFGLPIFLTHATPINVSVKPENIDTKESRRTLGSGGLGGGGHNGRSSSNSNDDTVGDCCCVIS